jgi:hypothetical protein
MQKKVTAIGDFAGAAIIAHEIGHHVQRIRGWNAEHTIEQNFKPTVWPARGPRAKEPEGWLNLMICRRPPECFSR